MRVSAAKRYSSSPYANQTPFYLHSAAILFFLYSTPPFIMAWCYFSFSFSLSIFSVAMTMLLSYEEKQRICKIVPLGHKVGTPTPVPFNKLALCQPWAAVSWSINAELDSLQFSSRNKPAHGFPCYPAGRIHTCILKIVIFTQNSDIYCM